MAYHVTQRRHEFGVRMALGASQVAVIRQTVRRAWWLARAGVIIGLVPAMAARGRAAERDLQRRRGPAGAVRRDRCRALAIAIVASLVPARQASKVDPAMALRSE